MLMRIFNLRGNNTSVIPFLRTLLRRGANPSWASPTRQQTILTWPTTWRADNDDGGWTALHWTVRDDAFVETTKFLFRKAGADPNLRSRHYCANSEEINIREDSDKIRRFPDEREREKRGRSFSLLSAPPSIEFYGGDARGGGVTPLIQATFSGAAETVRVLLNDSRVDVNLGSGCGMRGVTALMAAVLSNRTRLVKMLLSSNRTRLGLYV